MDIGQSLFHCGIWLQKGILNFDLICAVLIGLAGNWQLPLTLHDKEDNATRVRIRTQRPKIYSLKVDGNEKLGGAGRS